MANQRNNKILLDNSVNTENDIYNELERIIKRAKDENEALNNVLKNINTQKNKDKDQT